MFVITGTNNRGKQKLFFGIIQSFGYWKLRIHIGLKKVKGNMRQTAQEF